MSVPSAPSAIAHDELAAIIARAGRLGIPAWRVTTALGLGVSAAQPSQNGSS